MNLETLNNTGIAACHDRGDTGKFAHLHLIDSGISPIKTLATNVFEGSYQGLKDTIDHGTRVAYAYRRICPDTPITSYNVFPDGKDSIPAVIAAMSSVLIAIKKDPHTKHIVNMSIGGSDLKVAEIEELGKRICAAGGTVFTAAGNTGSDVSGKEYPAAYQWPVTIAALTKYGRTTDFTSWLNEMDFAEWGKSVPCMNAKGIMEDTDGTSIACPIAAAKATLICDTFYSRGMYITDDELYEKLKDVSKDLGEAGYDPHMGWGYIDLNVLDLGIPKIPTDPVTAATILKYVVDLKMPYPNGRRLRKYTDHIQIHHTVGDYSTEARWLALHNKRLYEDKYEGGLEYSFGVFPNGKIYIGRGLEYCHGAVKDSVTHDSKGTGAASRSVSITLVGDMRDEGMPTEAQYASALRLTRDIMAIYNLPVTKVLGHKEIPLAAGGLYATACPVISMDRFRVDVVGNTPIEQPAEETPVPTPEIYLPAYYHYAGSSFSNLRDAPSAKGKDIDDVKAAVGNVIVTEIVHEGDHDWGHMILCDLPIMKQGWCIMDFMRQGKKG